MSCGLSALLQPGAPNASLLEDVADCGLRYPRVLWLQRQVYSVKKEDRLELTYGNPSSGDGDYFFPRHSYGPTCSWCCCIPICMILPFYFVLVEMPAFVLTGLCMPIKATVLATSERANIYSKLAQTYLKFVKLDAEKKLIQEKMEKYGIVAQSNIEEANKLEKTKIDLEKAQQLLRANGIPVDEELTPLINKVSEKQKLVQGHGVNNSLQTKLDYVNRKIDSVSAKYWHYELQYQLAPR